MPSTAAVPCSDCKTTLVRHCESPGCRWLKCRNNKCEWRNYDLKIGARTNEAGRCERLGGPNKKTA